MNTLSPARSAPVDVAGRTADEHNRDLMSAGALYSVPMELDRVALLTDPDALPRDREEIPDDTLINLSVWAALQGVKKATVDSNRVRSEARRRAGEPKPGDMPPCDRTINKSPMWRMSTYRAWAASRPGKGAGAGRPKGTRKRIGPRKVALPVECPHCGHKITSADLREGN
ncbi:hypothetical protein ABZ801_01120 [Actinomadura sp. NPDC047616]|uniref:hypothetical protein n=1 Tax=Actinomadura sp. NPDC047616 TaxID=3155914 RepID=UPI003406B7C4